MEKRHFIQALCKQKVKTIFLKHSYRIKRQVGTTLYCIRPQVGTRLEDSCQFLQFQSFRLLSKFFLWTFYVYICPLRFPFGALTKLNKFLFEECSPHLTQKCPSLSYEVILYNTNKSTYCFMFLSFYLFHLQQKQHKLKPNLKLSITTYHSMQYEQNLTFLVKQHYIYLCSRKK